MKKITINEEDNTCDSDKAMFIVHWGGKLHKCCEEHAHQLRVLGSVIGHPVDVQPIITSEDCYMKKSLPNKEVGEKVRV